MTLLEPWWLVWCMLAVPVVVLYVRAVRPAPHRTGAGALWNQVLGPPRSPTAWWLVRRALSCGVLVAFLAGLVLAMAELDLRAPRNVVLVIDNSASMNATDVRPNRLEAAKRTALELIAAKRYRDRMAVVLAGGPPTVRCALGPRRELLEDAVANIPASQASANLADAVALAQQLLRRTGGQIVVLTDRSVPGFEGRGEVQDVCVVAVGTHGDNVGITRLAARRVPADPMRYQVFAEVRSYAEEPVACRLEIACDGQAAEALPVAVQPGQTRSRVVEFRSADAHRITARLDRPDVFLADNTAACRVGPQPVLPPSPDQNLASDTMPHLAPEMLRNSFGVAEMEADSAGSSRGWDASESDIRVVSPARPAAPMPDFGPTVGPLWTYLAGVVALALLVEWLAFHRRWTC